MFMTFASRAAALITAVVRFLLSPILAPIHALHQREIMAKLKTVLTPVLIAQASASVAQAAAEAANKTLAEAQASVVTATGTLTAAMDSTKVTVFVDADASGNVTEYRRTPAGVTATPVLTADAIDLPELAPVTPPAPVPTPEPTPEPTPAPSPVVNPNGPPTA